MRKRTEGPDLFAWADARPSAEVIDLVQRRRRMWRWILTQQRDPAELALLRLDKRIGMLPPTPIIPISLKTERTA